MERPDHIPEDIWETAIECADVVLYKHWVGVKAIATVLLTERERPTTLLNEIRDLGSFVAERKGK